MYCLLLAGPPASGKSVLAARLGKGLGIPVFSKDGFKERLFDRLGFSCREEKVALGLAAADLLWDCARAMLEAGQPFLLENNFETATKGDLVALLRGYDCKPLVLRLETELPVLYRRFCKRDRSPERHRGHVVNTCYPEALPGEEPRVIPFEDFCRGMRERGFLEFSLEEEIPGAQLLTLDTTDFARIDYGALLETLREAL